MTTTGRAAYAGAAGRHDGPGLGGPRTRLPRSERRVQLLDAAQDLFAAHGFHSVAMDEIALRAGVSKPVLYQHFPSKLELYLALLDRSADDLVAAIRRALGSTTDNAERVSATITAYLGFVDGDGAHRLVFQSDLQSEPQVAARLARMMREAVDAIEATIAADTGVDAAEARLLSVGLAGMAEVAARWWVSAPGDIDPGRAGELLSHLAWRGISGSPRRGPGGSPTA